MKKIMMLLVVASFLGLTACGSDTSETSSSSNLFGNLDISCESESCL